MNKGHLHDIEKQVAAQIKGRAAEGLLEQTREHFETLQRRYVQELVAKTVAQGKPAEAEVWKLVALGDVFEDLAVEVSVGRAASKRLDKISGGASDSRASA